MSLINQTKDTFKRSENHNPIVAQVESARSSSQRPSGHRKDESAHTFEGLVPEHRRDGRAASPKLAKVSPNLLLFGFSRTSGIPQIDPSRREVDKAHKHAIRNDDAAKAKMPRDFDRRMRVEESRIGVGDRVLLKAARKSKAIEVSSSSIRERDIERQFEERGSSGTSRPASASRRTSSATRRDADRQPEAREASDHAISRSAGSGASGQATSG